MFGLKKDVGAKSVGLFVTVRPRTEQWDRRKDFLELMSSEVPGQHDRESRVGHCCSHHAGREIENLGLPGFLLPFDCIWVPACETQLSLPPTLRISLPL